MKGQDVGYQFELQHRSNGEIKHQLHNLPLPINTHLEIVLELHLDSIIAPETESFAAASQLETIANLVATHTPREVFLCLRYSSNIPQGWEKKRSVTHVGAGINTTFGKFTGMDQYHSYIGFLISV